MITESIGILASLFLLVSMTINSSDDSSNIRMRILNIIASFFFIVYGIMLHGYSIIFINIVIILVHLAHIRRIKLGLF